MDKPEDPWTEPYQFWPAIDRHVAVSLPPALFQQPPAHVQQAPTRATPILPGGYKVTPAVQSLPIPANFHFQGGTPQQQQSVLQAIKASTFNFALLPNITINITQGMNADATPGTINLDAGSLNPVNGDFYWATILHEFGHQVDWYLVNDQQRQTFLQAFGRQEWGQISPSEAHDQMGQEDFASAFALAFGGASAYAHLPEANVIPPTQFKQMLLAMIPGAQKATGQ